MNNLRLTKRINLGVLVFVFAVFTIQAFSQNVTTPRPVSPAAELKQTIGISTITVNYSKPKVTLRGNNRTGKIWGQQIPYGIHTNPFYPGFGTAKEMPWRAGANENTTIEFSHDVKIQGKALSAGKYGLHMAVYKDNRVTLIFSKNYTSWGSFFYDPAEDALRVDTTMKDAPHTEALTYSVIDYTPTYGIVALSWEKKQIPFKVEFDTHNIVLANFRKQFRSTGGFGFQGYQTAVNYCINNNINHEEALKWANIAVARNNSFPTITTKARLLFQMGKTVDGDRTLDQAIAVATRPQINALGYQLLAQKRYPKAIEVLKMNVKSDPTDANAYDSLGEAYKQAGDKANAIKNLKKALSLNPPANVKANSEKLLKELGAM